MNQAIPPDALMRPEPADRSYELIRTLAEGELAPHLTRLNKADRKAVLDCVAEHGTIGLRAGIQARTRDLRTQLDAVLAENTRSGQALAAVRKAHQEAEQRAQMYRSAYTELLAERSDDFVARCATVGRRPWWAFWG